MPLEAWVAAILGADRVAGSPLAGAVSLAPGLGQGQPPDSVLDVP